MNKITEIFIITLVILIASASVVFVILQIWLLISGLICLWQHNFVDAAIRLITLIMLAFAQNNIAFKVKKSGD